MDEADSKTEANAESKSDSAPLFCPFCGECFEGERLCPDHEIPLVPFDALDRMRGRPVPDEHEEVAPYDMRFGRGWVWAGAALVLIGFFLPFVRSTYGNESTTASGFDAASTVALNLWVLPLLAVTWTMILSRRKTPAEMRGARVAMPLLCLMAASSLGYSLWRIHEGAARIRSYGQEVEIDLQLGAFMVAAGIVLALVGGVRLGTLPKPSPPKYDVE